MEVFISWSGDLSKSIAEVFKEWLPKVIQTIKPYYSPDDSLKEEKWNTEISKELEASKFGLILLTRDNLEKPWIMFEAGALSKNLNASKVCPILFELEPTDIQGPLIQFQSAKFSKEKMQEVLKTINSELEEQQRLKDSILKDAFENWWPELDEKIQKVKAKSNDLNHKKQIITNFCEAYISSPKSVLAINSTMPRNNDKWGQEKLEHIIDKIITLFEFLDGEEDVDKNKIKGYIKDMLNNALTVYGFFCDYEESAEDTDLIIKERSIGFENIKKRYKS
jgi:hypothetical protein